jgi:hypothetical protein
MWVVEPAGLRVPLLILLVTTGEWMARSAKLLSGVRRIGRRG